MEGCIGNGSPVGKLRHCIETLYFCLAEAWNLLADAVAGLKREHE